MTRMPTRMKTKMKKTTKRSAKAFGGKKIVPDKALGKVLGTTRPVSPSELTKRLWRYIKGKGLLK